MAAVTPFRPAVAAMAAGMLALLAGSGPALANEGGGGGGNACVWTQDVTLDFGRRSLTLTQAVFDPKTPQQIIDGYEMLPDLNQLVLRIIGPRGETYEAALTRVGSKRCIAYYVGKAVLVDDPAADEDAEPHRPVAAR